MIRTDKSPIPVFGITHPGMSGKNNEDNYSISTFRLSEKNETASLLAVISDGVGGHQAGEIASEMAVDIISKQIAQSDCSEPVHTLINAITLASQEIYAAAQTGSGRLGMGATVACVWINGNRLYTATVGDSRIYLIRSRSIRQLSIDHTWIQEALDLGVIKQDDVKGHPNSHVIRRYLGSPEPPEVDIRLHINDRENVDLSVKHQGEELHEGDIICLSTDGLTDLVSDPEILVEFTDNDLESAIQNLTDLANQRGGHDNITIVAAKIPKFVKNNSQISNKGKYKIGCLVSVIALLIISLVTLGWLLIRKPILNPNHGIFPKSTLTQAEYQFGDQMSKTNPVIITNTPLIAETLDQEIDLYPTLTPWPTHTQID